MFWARDQNFTEKYNYQFNKCFSKTNTQFDIKDHTKQKYTKINKTLKFSAVTKQKI